MREFLLNRSIWIGLIVWSMAAASFNLWQIQTFGSYSALSLFNMLIPITLVCLRSLIVLADLTKR